MRTLLILAAGLGLSITIQAQSPLPDGGSLGASATAARQQGEVPRAIELYRQAVAHEPRWLDGWWFLGNLQYATDQYAGAIDSLGHFIDLSPKAAPALALRGLCEFETHAYAESLQDIQGAIALGAANQPKNGQILLYHEALLLTRLGRFEEALAKYTAFVKQGTVNPDVAIGIGLAGLRMPVLPQALDPADAPAVAATGQAAIELLTTDSVTGRKGFRAVLAAFPNRPYVHFLCGYLLFTSDPDQAIEEFQQELTVSPESALTHAMLAWTLEFRGEYAEALPNARKAVAEDPSLAMDHLVLGRALVETENLKDGLIQLAQAVEIEPSNVEAHLSLAKAYSSLGRKDDARHERLLCLELSGFNGFPQSGPAPSATP